MPVRPLAGRTAPAAVLPPLVVALLVLAAASARRQSPRPVAGPHPTSVAAAAATDAAAAAAAAVPAASPATHNCRFWATAADSIPAALIHEHLVALPASLEQLSVTNWNGWSIGYGVPGDSLRVLHRGQPPAHLDTLFDVAVAEAMAACAPLAVAHVRRCSSGDCEIPNPHPFVRDKNGRRWWMGHNGSINVGVLLALIRPEYLIANPPENGTGPEDWIDSELYFLYLLQTLEEHDWQVKRALGEVVLTLRAWIPGSAESLNLFLTDGATLWSYREGQTLFYHATDAVPVAVTVASQYPDSVQGEWVELTDGELLTVVPGELPLIESIDDYFPATASVGDPSSPRHPAAARLRLVAAPSPFRIATRLELVAEGGDDRDDRAGDASAAAAAGTDGRAARPPGGLTIHDVTGRLVRRIVAARDRAGLRTAPRAAGSPSRWIFVWDGRDARGRRLPAGLYLVRGGDGPGAPVARVVLLR
ncbi:MAG: class II glutamine amidotransferase [Candidatus Eiseniibacteriota bacterium]|jgi:predicted glutamine amidotransferase